jgi:hypothetical protein
MKVMSTVMALLVSSTVMAAPDIELKGKITQTIPQAPSSQLRSHQIAPNIPDQTVTLMKVQLSTHAKNRLTTRTENIITHPTPEHNQDTIATHTQLGMNNVPVLNQGPYGTCATFAVTAALDAVLGEGDHISQLCHLQLGQRLEKRGYNPSGWDGSMTSLVLSQIDAFGIVNKAAQHATGCGGLTEYPHSSGIPTQSMSLSSYYAISKALPKRKVGWSALLDPHQFFENQADSEKKLELVKTVLRNHDRLVFGVLLFRLNEGVVGAVGQHNHSNDTWLLTQNILDDIIHQSDSYGGHAMIITGFDDDATAIDPEGHQHQGLLTLRNSWGSNAGDEGNFYMSYDYFKLLAFEIERIRSLEHAAA